MNDLWNRIQLVKVHYAMGSLSKCEFVYILGDYFKEATKLREVNHA
ncbi:UNVERIFIED_ORG: hypothetical protein ABID57_000669 [Arthrobacter sp. UYEF1]